MIPEDLVEAILSGYTPTAQRIDVYSDDAQELELVALVLVRRDKIASPRLVRAMRGGKETARTDSREHG